MVALVPGPALADDPHDPAMRSAAARARDREMIRQLNLGELARVRKRDAKMMHAHAQQSAAHARSYDAAMADYASRRAAYEQAMAEWRRSVAACRAGVYSACDN